MDYRGKTINTMAMYSCIAADQSPSANQRRLWLQPKLNDGPVCDAVSLRGIWGLQWTLLTFAGQRL